ncbi:MAG: hypothetical protein ACREUG_11675 [Steroidobacteraceae bacterium]
MKLKFRVASMTLSQGHDGGRYATVRLVPTRHDDNRVLWDSPPAGSIELHGIMPRNTETLAVGSEVDVTLEEAV